MLKVGSDGDRIVVCLIAALQFVVSFVLVFMQFMAYGGGFRPLYTPFLLFGFGNACFLFTARLLPRIGSFVWQSIFVAWVLMVVLEALSYPPSILVVCVLMLLSLIYLAASILQELAKRGWSLNAWLAGK